MVGIEKAKAVFRDFGLIVGKAIDIDEDGNGTVSTAEWTAFGFILIQRVLSQYGNIGAFLEEVKDADAKERKELLEALAEGFDIRNDQKEALIEDWAYFLERTYTDAAVLVERTRPATQPTA